MDIYKLFRWNEKITAMQKAAARGRVGRKGELFPPREIREQAGLKPGDEVSYIVENGRIEVEKIPSLKEAFSQKKFAKVSTEQFEEMTREILFESDE